MGAGSGAGVPLALWWRCHCTAIGAETGLGPPYSQSSEFMILNNGDVSGFFAQRFRTVQRLKRVTAPSCGMIGRIRRTSPVMGWRVPGLTCHLPPATCHLPPAAYGLRRARHHQRHDRGCTGGQQGLGGFVQRVAAGHHVIH